MKKFWQKKYFWRLSPSVFNLCYVAFTLLAYNLAFMRAAYRADYSPVAAAIITAAVFAAFNLILGICNLQRLIKPLAASFCVANSAALYFMDAYGVVIDKIMLLNVLQTDIYEVRDLLNAKMLIHLIFFGLLPAYLIYKTEIVYAPLKTELRQRAISNCYTLAIAALLVAAFYPQAEIVLRKFRYLKSSLIPANYISAGISVTKSKIKQSRYKLQKISHGATMLPQAHSDKPTLLVVVVGESARAANFSLQGYERPTNAALSPFADKLIYFDNFYSCGTSTAVSLPCIFAKAGRKDFVPESEKYTENVLDVIHHAGYKLLWRENNTDCKDNCNRIEQERFCQVKECPDEILLTDFAKKIRASRKPMLVVLHQRGSHGPLYRLRYPENFAPYQPVCNKEYLQDCSFEEIVNAYDNTLTYTSEMLAMTLSELTKLSAEYNTAFLFVSDHGESLGEDNIYLHSAPYDSAPDFQTHIPMMLWFSDGFAKANRINRQCVAALKSQFFSHDNIFHTLLGMSSVASPHYQENLDILAPCRQQ